MSKRPLSTYNLSFHPNDNEKLLSPAAFSLNEEPRTSYEPLVPSLLLREDLKISSKSHKVINWARKACSDVISGTDDRLIVIVGPCSIHDSQEGLEYARLLVPHISGFPDLIVVMRAYLEKPRTTIGWKGLINDPDLDGSFNINKGLRVSRKFLCTLTNIGLPVAVELLDILSVQFFYDLISWGAIGARTTESQLHRQAASGVLHPIGFKNGTDGDIESGVAAMQAASTPHVYIGVNEHGLTSIVKTVGNNDVQLILRGGKKGPNYSSEDVAKAREALQKSRPGFHPSLMIDCSHVFSHKSTAQKDFRNQLRVVEEICEQLRDGELSINGVMIESNIKEGRQDIPPEGREGLKHGVSVTDGCVNFETTLQMLRKLQSAVVERRAGLVRQQLHVEGKSLRRVPPSIAEPIFTFEAPATYFNNDGLNKTWNGIGHRPEHKVTKGKRYFVWKNLPHRQLLLSANSVASSDDSFYIQYEYLGIVDPGEKLLAWAKLHIRELDQLEEAPQQRSQIMAERAAYLQPFGRFSMPPRQRKLPCLTKPMRDCPMGQRPLNACVELLLWF
ncbi:hypothetical protein O181_017096 [Austropuccinia psidii MF-1]|uniref:3-deoxy-7-phosphoheptulonate synthase n=1 Tax=Austropuccinia psidii MF-1 TaxID=1389203 RepID=A0A9Q3C6Z4_9BASI|nr:hypothetical protein [Austropuccinia psidii MF-1]